MKKNDLETKSYQQLFELFYQSGGRIDINYNATSDELIDALLTGKKLLGGFVEDEDVLY